MTATAPYPDQLAAMLLCHRVADFYYAEAAMIDRREFPAWLDLFTEDARYLVPIRRNRADGEFSDPADAGIAHFDDGKDVLTRRVVRMTSGLAWTEDPPSVQRHLITNVRAAEQPNGDLIANSCFQAHRYRCDREVEVFTGEREDRLRPHGESFRIASRTVWLDHTTVLANNLNLFL